MAAVELGRARSDHVIDAGRITAPTFLYYGSADVPDSELHESRGPFGPPHILDGQYDHFTAFSDVGSVAPVVLAFLDTIYPQNEAGIKNKLTNRLRRDIEATFPHFSSCAVPCPS